MRIQFILVLLLVLGSCKKQGPKNAESEVLKTETRQKLEKSRDSLTELIESLQTEKGRLLQSTSENNPVVLNLTEVIDNLKVEQREIEGQLMKADQ
ncbi:hypothetical protein ACT6NV_02775 [Robiginitalea sp. IMCC44478]|uniref:hypothetical protein n=1 Tax=Robiginitalea sp. IMCC44478 TaxID=3459122 RepID=UPI0040435DEA